MSESTRAACHYSGGYWLGDPPQEAHPSAAGAEEHNEWLQVPHMVSAAEQAVRRRATQNRKEWGYDSKCPVCHGTILSCTQDGRFTAKFSRMDPANVDQLYITEKGKCFHIYGCSSIIQPGVKIKAYRPCSNCITSVVPKIRNKICQCAHKMD